MLTLKIYISLFCAISLSSCAIINTSQEVRVGEERIKVAYENDYAEELFLYAQEKTMSKNRITSGGVFIPFIYRHRQFKSNQIQHFGMIL